jgi:hypothetical protein
MMGWAGGPEIVSPLSEILSRTDDLQIGFKREALEALVAAPPDKALPVLEKCALGKKSILGPAGY